MIFQILFSKFSDVLSAFTYARAFKNFRNIGLGLNILRCETKTYGRPVSSVGSNGNNLLSKSLRTTFLSSKNAYKLLRVSIFVFFPRFFAFVFF